MNGGGDGNFGLIVSLFFLPFFFLSFFHPIIEQAAKGTLGLNIEQNGSQVSVTADAPESCASPFYTCGV